MMKPITQDVEEKHPEQGGQQVGRTRNRCAHLRKRRGWLMEEAGRGQITYSWSRVCRVK